MSVGVSPNNCDVILYKGLRINDTNVLSLRAPTVRKIGIIKNEKQK